MYQINIRVIIINNVSGDDAMRYEHAEVLLGDDGKLSAHAKYFKSEISRQMTQFWNVLHYGGMDAS